MRDLDRPARTVPEHEDWGTDSLLLSSKFLDDKRVEVVHKNTWRREHMHTRQMQPLPQASPCEVTGTEGPAQTPNPGPAMLTELPRDFHGQGDPKGLSAPGLPPWHTCSSLWDQNQI